MRKRIAFLIVALIMVSATLVFAAGTEEEGPSEAEAAGELTSWPLNSLTIVVPYNAGGTNDRQARALAPYIQEALGVRVDVENRPGGSTTVAYHTHKDNDPANGSHIIFGHHISFSTAVIRGEYEYTDFAPLGSMSAGHPVLMVNPNHSDIETFEEFLETVEANPNEISQAVGPGWGRVFDMILREEGLITRPVPVDGGANDRVMFMAGDIDFYISDYESTIAILDPSEFRVLAVLSENSPYSDELTVANEVMEELGYEGRFPNMITPRFFHVKNEFLQEYPTRFAFLSEVLKEAGLDPEFQGKMKDIGYFFSPRLPEENATEYLRSIFLSVQQYRDAF
jgi:putative tricarboxylic transport membrane protein